MRNALLQVGLYTTAFAGGWFGWSLLTGRPTAASEAPTRPHSHVEKPTDVPPPPPGYVEAVRESKSFVESNDLVAERDRFWAACAEPDFSEEEWRRYASELELHAEQAAVLCASAAATPAGTNSMEGTAVPMDSYLQQIGQQALLESQFKLRAFAAGEFRVAPFFPIPGEILAEDFEDALLIGHLSYEPMKLFVFRLDREADAELFELKRLNRYASAELLGEDGRLTELQHAAQRDAIRSRAGH